MVGLSQADHSVVPPRIDFPRDYNAAHDLLQRNLDAGRADKPAYIDDHGSYTYGELAQRVNRCASALPAWGVRREERVLMCLLDTIDFPSAFLGCIKAGVVPIPTNTLLTTRDYEYMMRDSRAGVLMVSAALYPTFAPLLRDNPAVEKVIVSGGDPGGHLGFDTFLDMGAAHCDPAPTVRDEPCFWLYSSGSTGAPKRHGACAFQPDGNGGALWPARPRHRRKRPGLFRRQAVFRLRAG